MKVMEWLNYHHLLYFWMVAKEGSITRAGEQLLVSQPTISNQIKGLEIAMGQKLFSRNGRRLVLTQTGRYVFEYADRIFSLGQELSANIRQGFEGRVLPLTVGVADAVPKLVVHALLEPLLRLPQRIRLICREHGIDRLVQDLSSARLDVVISDAPIGTGTSVQGFSHLLGTCGTTFVAAPTLARRLARNFPRSLDKAPVFLPAENSAARRSLDMFFLAEDLRPIILGEFEDTTLLPTFAHGGLGAAPIPSVIEAEAAKHFQLRRVGRLPKVRQNYYAITGERALKHPAVEALWRTARAELFGPNASHG